MSIDVKVLFFGEFRELAGGSEFPQTLPLARASLADLCELLRTRNDQFLRILADPDLVIAVNQVTIDGDCKLQDGDEIAFFPPITGG